MYYVIYLYITWLDFTLEKLKASLSYNISEAIQVPSVHSYMQRNTQMDTNSVFLVLSVGKDNDNAR